MVQVDPPLNQSLFNQPVQFPFPGSAQQFQELFFFQVALLVQLSQGFFALGTEVFHSGVGFPFGGVAAGNSRTHPPFETRGQHQSKRAEQGTEVVAAEPFTQGQVRCADHGRGFNRVQHVAGYFHLGSRGQFHHHALEGAATKGDPDQLAGFEGHSRRDAVGEGAPRSDRDIHRHFYVVHEVSA